MALEFTKKGRISLDGRDAVFEDGKPVNMPDWDFMKTVPKLVRRKPCKISEHLIESTFNRIMDPWTGMQLRSSFEQFEVFCVMNGLRCFREFGDLFYTVIIKDGIVMKNGDFLQYRMVADQIAAEEKFDQRTI